MTLAIDFVSPKGRFARSVNVERDAGSSSIESYLPTGRALDVVSRVAGCINETHATKAFYITGIESWPERTAQVAGPRATPVAGMMSFYPA